MTITFILQMICNTLWLHPNAVTGLSRDKEFVHCRDIFANIAYGKGYNAKDIAKLLNREDSSIRKGRGRFINNMGWNEVFQDKVARCIAAVEG